MTDRETMEGLEPAGLTAGGLFAKCRQYLDNLRVEMDADDPREAEVIGATRTLTDILERFTILRSRLEEVEEERRKWEDACRHNMNVARDRGRRSEALEGAVRTVLNEHRMAEDWSLPKRLEEYLLGVMADIDEPEPQGGELADRLRSALDSREDEGEEADRYCEKCRSTGWRVVEDEAGPPDEPPVITVKACSYCNPWGDDPSLNAGIPVHADEPEGGERGTPTPNGREWYQRVLDWLHGHASGLDTAGASPDAAFFSSCYERANDGGWTEAVEVLEDVLDRYEDTGNERLVAKARKLLDLDPPTDKPVSGEGEDDCLMGTPAEIDGCYRLLGSGELKTISDCPVHADEPEGGERGPFDDEHGQLADKWAHRCLEAVQRCDEEVRSDDLCSCGKTIRMYLLRALDRPAPPTSP